MTYFLMKYEDDNSNLYAVGSYVLAGSVGTIEEAERWAAEIYQIQKNEYYKPFIIEGRQINLDFVETVTAISPGIGMPKERNKKRK